MDELDFSAPAPKPAPKPAAPAVAPQPKAVYNPQVALQFFRGGGRLEEVPGGKTFFNENDKSSGLFSKGDRMYLLLEGEVGFMAKGQFLGLVRPGDIFGEMALLAKAPRTASAMAKVACKALSLGEKEFNAALEKTPEFALMMMAVMVQRLRANIARKGGVATPDSASERPAVFNRKELAELAKEIEPISSPTGKVIMNAGATGIFMYIVQEGKVAISVGETVVERVGAGGVFGEMAMVDNSSRSASAVAEADSTLLMIKRDDFLSLVKAKPEFGASILRTIAERIRAMA
jgi:CRP-like cAMP-binding protein